MIIDLDLAAIQNFAIAILIGVLIGIEREKRRDTEVTVGGIRTFVLLAILGAVGGYLSDRFDTIWPLLAIVALGGITVVAGFLIDADERKGPIGLITELAAIVVTMLAGLATLGQPALAVCLGIVVAALLAYKQPLHGLIDKIGWDDLFAGLRLLIASFIILPLLPDYTVDPWGALNPRKLWLLVVMISGLSMIGYVATRWLGPGRGTVITGLTGGLVSSTAATLAFSRQSKESDDAQAAQMLATGTLLAWAVMFFRVMVISFAVYPALLRDLAVPMTAMGLACLASAGVLLWRRRTDAGSSKPGEIAVSTPFTLTQATKFGLLFAVILLVVKIVGDLDLPGGLYVVAALAGLTDVDAISLSMAQHARGGAILVATIAIVIAALANTAVKAGMAASIGSAGYRQLILAATALIAVAGAAAIGYELTLSPPPQA
ncbi:MAG TPA: MgtC/SapB family protein [Dongiaceae bacterium]|nr:MgtC/SapB family protein [Dongiaceae bacterium]